MRAGLYLAVALPLGILLVIGAFFHFYTEARQPENRGALAPARLAARGERIPLLVACREQPLKVPPNTSLARAVSEDDLAAVLCGALPYWNPPSVPSAYHELMLWGRNAVFTKDMLGAERTGESLLTIVVNDEACRTNTVALGGSYLLDSPFGIRPVLMGTEDAVQYRAEAHYGQLLKLLAETGVASTMPVTTSSGRVGSIADLYQDAVMQFSLTHELEFIGCALAYWQPPRRTWQDQFGNEYGFDQLLAKLLATPLGKGSCGGCHVPYAVVVILRVDEQHPILSEEVRRQARTWLRTLAHLLEDRWGEQGGWDLSWAPDAQSRLLWGDDLLDRITVTGHHLEWMALAPDDCRPSETLVKRAVQALRRDVESLPPLGRRPFKTLLPVSHAGRALALFRGDDPFTVWAKYRKTGRLKPSEAGFVLRGPSK